MFNKRKWDSMFQKTYLLKSSFYEELLQLSVLFWIWLSDNEQKKSASSMHGKCYYCNTYLNNVIHYNLVL